jgi:pyruvate dehydrogenase E1 component alpha subunit
VPRETLKLANRVEKIEVLSHDGKLDTALEPKLPDADLRKIYRYMLATRMLDERCLHLQRQGRIGTYGPCKGQEATPLGVAYHLKKEDWFVPTYRELPAFLWRGWPIDRYMMWWGGHEIGSKLPDDVNDTPICVPIGSQVQYAAGIAWGCKLRKEKTIVACFCGDGGTSEGDFHEGLNFATVFNVPMVLVVQNNHWAISVPRHKQTHSQTIAQKAIAYGIDAFIVDGNDVLSVLVAMKEAAEKARNGGGPTLIEAVTYRLSMHTTADDPKKYRSDEEVKSWEAKDPLPRFQNYLRGKKLLDDKIQALLEDEIRKELDAAVASYEKYVPDPFDMFKYMYAEPTPELERQRAELRAHLDGAKVPESHAAAL